MKDNKATKIPIDVVESKYIYKEENREDLSARPMTTPYFIEKFIIKVHHLHATLKTHLMRNIRNRELHQIYMILNIFQ